MTTAHLFPQGYTRRRFLRLATLGTVGVMVAANRSRAYASPNQDRLQLNLPPYPFFSNLQSVMTEDRALLDRLVKAYARATPATAQDPIDFIARYVPVYVFERTLKPSDPDDPKLPTLLWLMHLAGYFGGVWLRTAFVNTGVPRGAFPVGEASFSAVVTRINVALAAFSGNNASALAYAEASLRGGNLQGLTDNYGYNAGYLDQILTGAKPTNAIAPAGYFTYNPTTLFDATYSVPEIKPLAQWRHHTEEAARRPGSRYAALVNGNGGADALPTIQATWVFIGKSTWAPGNPAQLNISNFNQATYNLLLGTSAYFLQCIQGTALAALAATSVGNADWARAAVRSNAMTVPYGGSYGVGLFDGTGQLPTFTTV